MQSGSHHPDLQLLRAESRGKKHCFRPEALEQAAEASGHDSPDHSRCFGMLFATSLRWYQLATGQMGCNVSVLAADVCELAVNIQRFAERLDRNANDVAPFQRWLMTADLTTPRLTPLATPASISQQLFHLLS